MVIEIWEKDRGIEVIIGRLGGISSSPLHT